MYAMYATISYYTFIYHIIYHRFERYMYQAKQALSEVKKQNDDIIQVYQELKHIEELYKNRKQITDEETTELFQKFKSAFKRYSEYIQRRQTSQLATEKTDPETTIDHTKKQQTFIRSEEKTQLENELKHQLVTETKSGDPLKEILRLLQHLEQDLKVSQLKGYASTLTAINLTTLKGLSELKSKGEGLKAENQRLRLMNSEIIQALKTKFVKDQHKQQPPAKLMETEKQYVQEVLQLEYSQIYINQQQVQMKNAKYETEDQLQKCRKEAELPQKIKIFKKINNKQLQSADPTTWIRKINKQNIKIQENIILSKNQNSAIFGPIMKLKEKEFKFMIQILNRKQMSIGIAVEKLSVSGNKIRSDWEQGQLVELSSSGKFFNGTTRKQFSKDSLLNPGDFIIVQVTEIKICWTVINKGKILEVIMDVKLQKNGHWVPYICLGKEGQIRIIEV